MDSADTEGYITLNDSKSISWALEVKKKCIT